MLKAERPPVYCPVPVQLQCIVRERARASSAVVLLLLLQLILLLLLGAAAAAAAAAACCCQLLLSVCRGRVLAWLCPRVSPDPSSQQPKRRKNN